MRFEVPQFIEVEDKIFGPFTWKQFIYLAGGAGTIVVLYLTLPFFIFVLIGIPIVALSGTLAFHKINDRPFSLYLESMFSYFMSSKLYLWKRKKQQTITYKTAAQEQQTQPQASVYPSSVPRNLQSLSRRLETDPIAPNKEILHGEK